MIRFYGDKSKADAVYAYVLIPISSPAFAFSVLSFASLCANLGWCSGCEPLTPDDVAEVIVFTAGRRENVVIADTMIYPQHQVRKTLCCLG